MQLPARTPPVITYHCNICGTQNTLAVNDFYRELALCSYCGANSRFRGIIGVLAGIVGEDASLPLQYWSPRKEISGLGMSDWPGYATMLSERFAYVNTFYDQDPKLDIQNIEASFLDAYDFVISTDVFEHILQPLQNGFDNLRRIIKPGGHLVFSVPYTRTETTLEHFPDLHDFKIIDFYGTRVLLNKTRSGSYQVYDKLIFHGGSGSTLEMRLFCEADILRRLQASGFKNITVHERPALEIGYYWPKLYQEDRSAPFLYAYIISAQK